jgi:hypothetical protein
MGHAYSRQRMARLTLVLISVLYRKEQTERLQKYAKSKELERGSLEKQVTDNKMAHIFAKVAQMSLSSYVRVWSHLAVKNRGRRLQVLHTLTVLSRRKDRSWLSVAFKGWGAHVLEARKVEKVRSVISMHICTRFFGMWCYNFKMHRVAKTLYQAGRMEDGKKEYLLRRSWRAWVLQMRYLQRLRKAIKLLQGGYEGRTIKEFLLNWRAISAANLLKKAGFGAKSKAKPARQGPGIQRTGSASSLWQRTGSSGPQIQRTGSSGPQIQRTGSSGPQIQRTGSSGLLIQRTASSGTRPSQTTASGKQKVSNPGSSEIAAPPRIGKTGASGISRVSSFNSIFESDDEDNMSLQNDGSPLLSPARREPNFGRLGSTASNASATSSFRRTPSSKDAAANRRGGDGSPRSNSSATSISPLGRSSRNNRDSWARDALPTLDGEELSAARHAVGQEAFLSTLLRKGGTFEI